jgi:hypothetical protein
LDAASADRERVLGPDHPTTRTIDANLEVLIENGR